MEINIAVENSDIFEIVSSKHKVFWVKWVKVTTMSLKKSILIKPNENII